MEHEEILDILTEVMTDLMRQNIYESGEEILYLDWEILNRLCEKYAKDTVIVGV